MLTDDELAEREAMRKALLYPPVTLTGAQALCVANGFRHQATTSNYQVWACSILPEHTHLVVARHKYKSEQIANLLKGAATTQLIEQNIHPLQKYAKPGSRPPGMWARGLWKVYLDSDEQIENAINYVRANPIKENKPEQKWSWIKGFCGTETCWFTYH